MDLYNWKESSTLPCNVNSVQFWTSVDIWIHKPHCLNKKIGGVDTYELGLISDEDVSKCIEYLCDGLHSFKACTDLETSVKLFLRKFCETFQISKEPVKSYEVVLRFLYSKNGQYFPENVELILKDHAKQTVVFIKPVSDGQQKLVTNLPYAISLDSKNAMLFTMEKRDNDVCVMWIYDILLPKLVSWMENGLESNALSSNRLISTNKYLLTYSRLKEKYYSSILQFWKESTNPEKFINEDIAIASYLLVFWGNKMQNFVDLGCGNGLLVYILTSEGHKGLGIDVRARKIWNDFPSSVILKVDTISPSLECVFPEADWLIGNHSDELTPWIPIIAARSSYTTNFFILPCCPFELNGYKYVRNNTSKSCYLDYMDYLENICRVCGIDVERDRLKIPSTKRICLVSKKRLYTFHDHFIQEDSIKKFLKLKLNNSGELKVKLRSPEEAVKNCTQLSKEYLEKVVLDVANFIINSSTEITSWREGEMVHIRELVTLLSLERRKFLKAQCGGLQTLLKNHHHIFLVYSGKVKLRKPVERKPPPKITKQKKCWFYFNHPDSCPLSDEHCSYKHTC